MLQRPHTSSFLFLRSLSTLMKEVLSAVILLNLFLVSTATSLSFMAVSIYMGVDDH